MSVTKLYLTNRAPGFTPTNFRGTWNDTASAVTKALDGAAVWGGASTTVAKAETSATNPFDVCLYRGVSGPLGAQTPSGTIDMVIGILESSASADFNWKVHVYATQGDTDTVRGTLLSNYTENAGTNEWPTTGTVKGLNAAQTLTGVALTAGDRIVVEIGYRARNAVTTSFTGTLRYGSADANGAALTDAVAGNASAATDAMFVKFSVAITEAVPVRVSQAVWQEVSTQAAAPTIRVSQALWQEVSTQAPAPVIRVSQCVWQFVSRIEPIPKPTKNPKKDPPGQEKKKDTPSDRLVAKDRLAHYRSRRTDPFFG